MYLKRVCSLAKAEISFQYRMLDSCYLLPDLESGLIREGAASTRFLKKEKSCIVSTYLFILNRVQRPS